MKQIDTVVGMIGQVGLCHKLCDKGVMFHAYCAPREAALWECVPLMTRALPAANEPRYY